MKEAFEDSVRGAEFYNLAYRMIRELHGDFEKDDFDGISSMAPFFARRAKHHSGDSCREECATVLVAATVSSPSLTAVFCAAGYYGEKRARFKAVRSELEARR